MATVRTLSEIEERLEAIGERPGMYFSEPYYEKLSSYIEGCDFVLNGAVLAGFEDKLKSLGAPENLTWSGAFLITLLGDEKLPWDVIAQDSEEDVRACRALIKAVVECRHEGA